MKTTTVKTKDIKLAEYNPRETLQPGGAEYEALKNSVERFGMAAPLIINERTGRLVSGHQRLNILMDMGVEETEAVLVDMDEAHEKGLNLALNKIEGFWDYEKLEAVLSEMEESDLSFTGFSADELENLLDSEINREGFYESLDEAEVGGNRKTEDGFTIYLSFPSRERAERWIEEKGVKTEIKRKARTLTIRMEGLSYGNP